MKAVFADTFHFLALLNATDPAHERALRAHREPWSRIITTEAVLLELGDALSQPADHADFFALNEAIRRSPRFKLVPLDDRYFSQAIELRRERPDKAWSLTDCISFVVMAEQQIHEALTGDKHFEQAGFRALLK